MNSLSFLDKIRSKRILIAPLNWGLGHASRCIPIIKKLSLNNKILIGSDGDALLLLQSEFPSISTVTYPSYRMNYESNSFLLGMIKQSPKIALNVSKELALTEEVVDRFGIDMVISDHRLGCRDDRIWSVIMAHQIQIQHSNTLASLIGQKSNAYFINTFNECWIPDYADPNLALAGELSRSKGLKNYQYIGPLSRLKPKRPSSYKYDILILLSGPEPRRTELEIKLARILDNTMYRVACIRGSNKDQVLEPNYLLTDDIAQTERINHLMSSAKVIICRSGYSSVMDIMHMNAKAIMIPTKGQTEQEYLALHLKSRENLAFLTEAELCQSSLLHAYHELTD